MGRYSFNSQKRVIRAPIPTTLASQTKLAIANSASDPTHSIKEVRQMSATEFHVYREGMTKKGVVVARYRDGKLVEG
jgi:hypothetical protein